MRLQKYLKEGQNLFFNNKVYYRNTNIKWLLELLKKKNISQKFISFSLKRNSGAQDNFGDTLIIFNSKELDKQGIIEIYYEPDFFEKYEDLSLYITGYANKEDFDNQFDDWESELESYEHEQELVLKNKLKYTSNLIELVYLPKKYKKYEDILNKNKISYELK